MDEATARPRDSSRENRIGPREKISTRTGQPAAAYVGRLEVEIQCREIWAPSRRLPHLMRQQFETLRCIFKPLGKS
jgi:hypothetical protein